MTELTLHLPDELAERLGRSGRWLPAILGLSLDGYGTRAAAAAREIIAFLSSNPSAEAVMEFHLSEVTQNRLRRLLALNSAGMASSEEQAELEELERIEHFVVMLKAQTATSTSRDS